MSFILKPAVGKEFVWRKQILARLMQELRDKDSTNGFALYGKRRVGKTSILLEARRRLLEEKNIVPIYISVWDLVEWRVSEFCDKIISETIDEYKNRLGIGLKFRELAKLPYDSLT